MFNGLVIAAQVLDREGRARRVGILDFDQHYGNGTTDIKRELELDWIEHYSAAADWDRPEQAEKFLASIPAIVQRIPVATCCCTGPAPTRTSTIRSAAG